jgi:hypothetical protein
VSTILTQEDLAVFRTPEDLCALVEPDNLGISDEDFFNKANGGLNQKLREAWVLSRLGIAISYVIEPVQVSVADGRLLDGLMKFECGKDWKFEVVTVLPPERQPGVEYRRGRRPPQKLSDFSGEPSDPTWPREPILAKVQKVKKLGASRHLVAYLDYGGGVPDLIQIASHILQAKNAFQTLWLLTGGMFALLFDQIDTGFSKGAWHCYLKWLPPESQP